jgi:hypothetical protein
MAALILVNALVELAWAIAMRGASVPLDLLGAHMLANRYVYPLLAVASLCMGRGIRRTLVSPARWC